MAKSCSPFNLRPDCLSNHRKRICGSRALAFSNSTRSIELGLGLMDEAVVGRHRQICLQSSGLGQMVTHNIACLRDRQGSIQSPSDTETLQPPNHKNGTSSLEGRFMGNLANRCLPVISQVSSPTCPCLITKVFLDFISKVKTCLPTTLQAISN